MTDIIPPNQLPTNPAQGLIPFVKTMLRNAGKDETIRLTPDGLQCSDATLVLSAIAAYSGSATELADAKSTKQAALDLLLDQNFDLKAFIRAGTAAGITGANIGTFLATITNNYRTLRAAIAAAATVQAVQAINVNSGWPNNP